MLSILFYIPLIIAIVLLVKGFSKDSSQEQGYGPQSANERIVGRSQTGTMAKRVATGIVAFGFVLFIIAMINAGSNSFYRSSSFGYWIVSVIPYFGSMTLLPFAILAVIEYYATIKCNITVTDKRVYGLALFGKRVDLPIDSISAVGKTLLKGIAVGTSSGKIRFFNIDNQEGIHDAISKLLIDRQGKAPAASTTTIKQEIPQSNADEIRKYKELLDSSIITQEEFEAKKKQLLGL